MADLCTMKKSYSNVHGHFRAYTFSNNESKNVRAISISNAKSSPNNVIIYFNKSVLDQIT